MTGPTPIASGVIGDPDFGELLFSVHLKRFTGSLVIAEPGGEQRHCVTFRDGHVFKVRYAEQVDLLGELLVEFGSLRPEQVAETLTYAGSLNLLFGEAAVMLRFCQPAALQQALLYQALRRVARLFAISSGAFGIYGEDFLAAVGGNDSPVMDPLMLIAVGVRSAYGLERLTPLVAPLQGSLLNLVSNPQDVARFSFNENEIAVLQAFSEPMSLDDLMARSGQHAQMVYQVVHVLQVTKRLVIAQGEDTRPEAWFAAAGEPARSPEMPFGVPEPGDGAPAPFAAQPIPSTPSLSSDAGATKRPSRPPSQRPSSQPLKRPSAYPSKHPAAPQQEKPQIPQSEKSSRRLEVEALLERVDAMNFFELLGVTREATDSDVQNAYSTRARLLHPDRATGDLAELRAEMSRLFSRVGEARAALKTAEDRALYLEELDADLSGMLSGPRDSDEDIVRRALEADEAFFKAKILLKRKQLDQALEFAQVAAEFDPEQGDYEALVIWIEVQKLPAKQRVAEYLERMEKAVGKAPNSENAHHYLAQLYYRDGQHFKALREFEAVMEINENNIEAVRMVRILRRKLKDDKVKKGEAGTSLFKKVIKELVKKR